MMKIDITPIGKPRQTQSDRWKQRPVVVRYRAFCDELRYKFREEFPGSVRLKFTLPIPKSWSAGNAADALGGAHTQRPDIDNLIKAVLDALCADDSYVWRLEATKVWGKEGAIEIEAL